MERRCLGCQRKEEQRNFERAVKELPLLLKDKYVITAKLNKLITQRFHVTPAKVTAAVVENRSIIQEERGNRRFHFAD